MDFPDIFASTRSRPTYPVRAETWDREDGARGGLLAAVAHGTCLLRTLRRDPVSRTWSEGFGTLPAGNAGLSLKALLGAVREIPARPAGLNVLGATHGVAISLSAAIGGWLHHGEARNREDIVPGLYDDLPFAEAYFWTALGAHRHMDLPDLVGEALAAPLGPVAGSLGHPVRRVGIDALRDFLRPWCTDLADLVSRDHPFLWKMAWSNEASAYYSAPGTVGLYRRQAGELYPFLASLIPATPGIAGLVDAGRPFEHALAWRLRPFIEREHRDGFGPGRLRSLRGLTDNMLGRGTHTSRHWFVEKAASLPLHTLPKGGEEWVRFACSGYAVKVDAWAGRRGLDFVDLVGGVTDALRERVGPDLEWVDDMVRRCSATLAAPFLGPSRKGVSEAVAARLLFAGKDIIQVAKACGRWHAELSRFEAALPAGRDLSAWPALFEPFEYGGYRVECLVRPSQLRDEGIEMDHCSGGYAARCNAGETHVASVRRRDGDGWLRVSTVEFQVGAIEMGMVLGEWRERPRLRMMQHRSFGNGKPERGAIEAVEVLRAGIAAGDIPLDPRAVATYGRDAFEDGIDWSNPGVQAQALDAWRPYLPKGARRLDPAGLKQCLAGMADEPAPV